MTPQFIDFQMGMTKNPATSSNHKTPQHKSHNAYQDTPLQWDVPDPTLRYVHLHLDHSAGRASKTLLLRHCRSPEVRGSKLKCIHWVSPRNKRGQNFLYLQVFIFASKSRGFKAAQTRRVYINGPTNQSHISRIKPLCILLCQIPGGLTLKPLKPNVGSWAPEWFHQVILLMEEILHHLGCIKPRK